MKLKLKTQSIVSEKFFEGKVYGQTHARTEERTHDGHNAMTIAHWPLASAAKNQGMFRKGTTIQQKFRLL